MTKLEKEIVKINIRQQINGKYVAPIILRGPVGVGKSTGLKAIASELNMDILSYSGTILNIESLQGIPDFSDSPEASPYSVIDYNMHKNTQWSIPEIIYQANISALSNKNGCVILIDDIHTMQPTAQAALYELLLERKLGNYKLLPNVAVVLTENDSTEAGFDGHQSAIINRMQILKVQFNASEWYEQFGLTMNTYVSSFLKLNFNFLQEQESTTSPYGTPRAWDFLSNTLDGFDREFIIENAFEIANQYVSFEAATEFAAHIAYIEKINFREKLDSGKIVDISKINPNDQLIYPFIFDWVETVKDAKYCIDLLNKNKNVNSFIGFSSGRFWAIYKKQEVDNIPITKAQSILLDFILNRDISVKLNKKEQDIINSCELTGRSEIMAIMNKYILD